MKKSTGSLLITMLLLSGCQKNFNPPLPGDSKMVVNSMFNSNGPMVVYLTTSYPASNKNNNVVAIADAQIALYEDTVFKEILHYIPSDTTFGYYTSNLTPQNGKTYNIQVSEKNYPTSTTRDQIPLAPQIISCNLVQFPDTLSGNVIVNMEFQDDPDTVNYYQLDMYLSGAEYYIDNNDTFLETFTNTIEPFVNESVNDTVRGPSKYLLFSNRGFSGQLKQLQIQGSVSALSSKIISANLFVELHAISKAHYEYYQSLQIYNSTSGSTGIQSYVFSNIINGYGIFCGENWQENNFKLR